MSRTTPDCCRASCRSNGWQDTWTTGREFADCGLLKRYYDAAPAGLTYTVMDRAHIAGHRWNQVCEGPANTNMASRTPFYIDPTVGGAGLRHRPTAGRSPTARHPLHPAGLQDRGLRPARRHRLRQDAAGQCRHPVRLRRAERGQITVEQFVQLNEQIGGYDINGQWQPSAHGADPGAAEIAHASGRVPHGRGLGEVAIIAGVDFNILEEHYDFRNYVIRNRILAVHGDFDNHVHLAA